MKTAVIIPARYKSTRFPGKPLIMLAGKPMIVWVAELCGRAVGPENVYVATEDQRIMDVVNAAGFTGLMTGDDALTGTDRTAEAAGMINADVFINVQGDEPVLSPDDILKIADVKKQNMNKIVNGYCWMTELEDPHSVNIPKVITNEKDDMVYMSRKAIPGFKDPAMAPARYKKQVCIYGFTLQELQDYRAYGRKSVLEKSEDIEILRFLEWGKKIMMVETSAGSLAVDIPDDVHAAEKRLREIHKL